MSGSAPYRVAARTEGEFVNVYWAPLGTMVGAELIGSLKVELVDRPVVREGFTLVLQAVAAELTQMRLGVAAVGIDITQAPEHEKAGRA